MGRKAVTFGGWSVMAEADLCGQSARDKDLDYALRVDHGNLCVRLLQKAGTRIDGIAFREEASDRIEGFFARQLDQGVDSTNHSAV